MSRRKTATKIIDYLEKRINCENIMRYTDEYLDNNSPDKSLVIDEVPVSFTIIPYNANENYSRQLVSTEGDREDKPDFNDIKHMFDVFDFMTEANNTGFEHFPYIYGVLDCLNDIDSTVYVYYEKFDGTLPLLIDNIEHPSDWYDIVFQIVLIIMYIKYVGKMSFKAAPERFLYKKITKPYYKEYSVGDTTLNINHKYLIVCWDTNTTDFEGIQNSESSSENKLPIIDLDFLTEYINVNKDSLKIQPSNRIIKLIQEIKNQPDNIPKILVQYYGPQ
ncbi:hypothetical protein [Acanthamoeba castellanii mimivirus]|jgi:hypothetical protein|uniref:Uncharacterized protein R691 n=5 Tax=Mimivirus TaxID=315393 RepID=YR691_MIMIV|nr:hypothetical protein MIMI_gp0747 [Acanthamoeba polyphaga mimivirus]Q5UNV1.1 RecName: Full=Uncharacterized protein R691 [Acanthamoeba polyphaga mimivirus]AHA45144.1 hypothetical protein HIRU_S238 [Hirudovirus strain Sangsue]AHJ40319.1 hypothetical protein [Samba virus]ALR84313.1 hypothetical protein [Niemeyer virus]AMZ03135.1 hypothetical protein [Mimivirus Bombay]BAV61821.1 hypothetical protein [Acanthamoeba castellanii mimivirus]